MGEHKRLRTPELSIHYGDKIGILGDNGAGKSTFLNHMLAVEPIPKNRLIYIPQEIPILQAESILKRVQNYTSEHKGQIMSIIRRLGSDPTHVLETTVPSPGEVRKLLLADGLSLNPSLIIMDEPTNRMDIPSIECIEHALIESPCAQLLVSHDMTFLKNTVDYFWSFSRDREGEFGICVL